MGTKDDNERLLKFFIYPSFMINFIILLIVPEYRTAGLLYSIIAAFTIYTYSVNRFQDNVIGLRFTGKGVAVGLIGGFAFIIINKAIPSFALGMPSLPLSLIHEIQAVIIIVFAPVLEEGWRGSVIGQIKSIYGVSDEKANLIQSPIFSAIHLLAYGIFLGAYSTWIALYGAVTAISGLFIAALIAGFFFGWMMIKFNNTLPSQISHAVINAFLFTAGYVVVF